MVAFIFIFPSDGLLFVLPQFSRATDGAVRRQMRGKKNGV
jgi:hypothetical protein